MKSQVALYAFAGSLITVLSASEAHATTTCPGSTSWAENNITTYAVGVGLPLPNPPTPLLTANFGKGGFIQAWTNDYVVLTACDDSGTFGVHGFIKDDYASGSTNNSTLENLIGFPISNEETDSNNNPVSYFEGGEIHYVWHRSSAAEIGGWIRTKWNALGGYNGVLGYPTSNEGANSQITGGRINNMDHGFMLYDPGTNPWNWETSAYAILNERATFASNQTSITVQNTHMGNDTYGEVKVSVTGFAPASKINVYGNLFNSTSVRESGMSDAEGGVVIGPMLFNTIDCATTDASGNPILTLEVRDQSGHIAVAGVAILISQ